MISQNSWDQGHIRWGSSDALLMAIKLWFKYYIKIVIAKNYTLNLEEHLLGTFKVTHTYHVPSETWKKKKEEIKYDYSPGFCGIKKLAYLHKNKTIKTLPIKQSVQLGQMEL